MKKLLTIVAAALPFCGIFAESIILFDPAKHRMDYNAFGNASTARPPDGAFVEISFRPDGKTNGAFQTFYVEKKLPASGDFDRIAVTLRGEGSVRVGISTAGNRGYCWNGKLWESSSEIVVPKKWTEKIFFLRDFQADIRAEFPPLTWPSIRKIFISGTSKKYPTKVYVRGIRLLAPGEAVSEKSAGNKKINFVLPDRIVSVKPGPEKWVSGKTGKPLFTDWNAPAYEESTEGRRKIYLNHYWRLIPVPESAIGKLLGGNGELPAPLPPRFDGEKVFTKIPGRWDGRNFDILSSDGKKVERWNKLPFCDYLQAYLCRTVRIPSGLAGKKLVLEFRGINSDGDLYVNGRHALRFRKAVSVDVTNLLKPGCENEIALLVGNARMPLKKNAWTYALLRQLGPTWFYRFSEGPGIIDDVVLHVLPRETGIADMQLIPAVSEGKLGIRALLENRGKISRTVMVSATVLDHGIPVLKIPAAKVVLPSGKSTRFFLSTAWSDAKKWTPDTPDLYEVLVTVRDKKTGKILDEIRDRFGYREFRVRGSQFILNGTPIRLNWVSWQGNYRALAPENLRALLSAFREMHYNGIMIEDLNSSMIRMCDELGLMVVIRHVFTPLVRDGKYLPGVPNKGIPYRAWLDDETMPEARRELENQIAGIVTSFRNNPSVVLWALNPLLVGAPNWINPNRLCATLPESDIIRATLREEAFVRALDPVREVIQSMAGPVGIANTCNPYPTFSIQPDEWADWPNLWSKTPSHKKKPLVLEEVALPYSGNWGTWSDRATGKFRPYEKVRQLFSEQAARYAGEDAYSNLPSGNSWETFSDRRLYDLPNGGNRSDYNPAALKGSVFWMDRVLKFWRWYGISGIWSFLSYDAYFSNSSRTVRYYYKDVTSPGRKPDFAPGPVITEKSAFFNVTKKIQKPFLAFLGNGGVYRSSLEHNFYAGEKVTKSVLVSNLSMINAAWSAEWKLIDEFTGGVAASGTMNGELKPTESGVVEFSFRLPGHPVRRTYKLELFARGFGEHSTDSIEISAFPHPRKIAAGRVLLYDENGSTRRMLESFGVKILPFDSAQSLNGNNLPLVVGTNSLSKKFFDLVRKSALDESVRKNGRSILVMAQTDSGAMKHLLEERRSRHVYIRDSLHPILRNISGRDLKHWRGKSALVVEWPKDGTIPGRMMFWGSKDVVAPFVCDKPKSGFFRVILDSDANLSRAVLLELFHGKGRVVFNQLELENRIGLEPAADLLAGNLIEYLGKPIQNVSNPVVFRGGEKMFQALNTLGFNMVKSSDIPAKGIWILEPASGTLPDDAVREFLRKGGSILMLAPSGENLAKWKIPGGFNLERKKVRNSLVDTSSETLRGLGCGDFYFNTPSKRMLSKTSSFGWSLFDERRTEGGKIVFLGVNPQQDFSTSTADQAKRIVSTILGNLGAEARPGILFPDPERAEIDLNSKKCAFSTDPFDKGLQSKFADLRFNDSAWKKILPGSPWETQGVTHKNPNKTFPAPRPGSGFDYDGVAWYRIHVHIPESVRGKNPRLLIQSVDDADETFFNGVRIGVTGTDVPEHWQVRRNYPIPEKLIRFGTENVIAVRVTDNGGGGGIIGKIRIVFDGCMPAGQAFFDPSSRDILGFDPNEFRQW